MWYLNQLPFILACLAGLTVADISDTNPPTGSCICVDGNSVNVRDTACGNVIGVANNGNCYTYQGSKVGCYLSGTYYQFFNLDYNGGDGWVAGTYLVTGSESDCGTVAEPTSEFRSVFIATAWNVDWPTSSTDSSSSEQQQLVNYLNMMTSTHMNAIVFQVRPCGDAMYSSNIEPWSKYLTGTQGTAPSPFYDPLSYLITEAHSRGIEIHAWLNPYRANLAPNKDGLAPNHMANVYPQYAYVYGNYLWMDPGASVIVDHLVSVIEDILTRYDVDGIHFDDYFYPYPDGTQFPDSATYNAYVAAGGSLSRDDWRRDNVNRMVERVYGVVHSKKPGAKFSISPFGIYRPGNPAGMPAPITGLDPYTELYADSKKWLQSGWVDFLAPQLYWAIDPPAQSYPVLLDWWLDANTANRHIYAANGVYKIADSNNWAVSEIENQIAISRDSVRRSKLSLGNVMYSAKYFRDNTKGITDAFQARVYTQPATIPQMSWLRLAPPSQPTGVKELIATNGNTFCLATCFNAADNEIWLQWMLNRRRTGHNMSVDETGSVLSWSVEGDDSSTVRWWLVTVDTETQSTVHAVLPHTARSVSVEPTATYTVRGVNAAWQFSHPVTVRVA